MPGVIFGLTIFDFNRLRRTGIEGAVPIAASIFVDVLNVFRFALQLFGGRQTAVMRVSTKPAR